MLCGGPPAEPQIPARHPHRIIQVLVLLFAEAPARHPQLLDAGKAEEAFCSDYG
jgi:hypothetical protein